MRERERERVLVVNGGMRVDLVELLRTCGCGFLLWLFLAFKIGIIKTENAFSSAGDS